MALIPGIFKLYGVLVFKIYHVVVSPVLTGCEHQLMYILGHSTTLPRTKGI